MSPEQMKLIFNIFVSGPNVMFKIWQRNTCLPSSLYRLLNLLLAGSLMFHAYCFLYHMVGAHWSTFFYLVEAVYCFSRGHWQGACGTVVSFRLNLILLWSSGVLACKALKLLIIVVILILYYLRFCFCFCFLDASLKWHLWIVRGGAGVKFHLMHLQACSLC
jgi:hypothetical protein